MQLDTAPEREIAQLSSWQPIDTAPKDRYILGCEAGMKRPYIMIWNVPDQCFSVSHGMDDETPSHWMELPPVPR